MLYVKLFTKAMYVIWIQRNNKILKGAASLATSQIMYDIVFEVSARCKDDFYC